MKKFAAIRRIVLATVFAGILPASLVQAEVSTPCNETVNKFCKDVVPGGGRIMKCLNDHRDDQSIACKDWIDDQLKSLNELMALCREEIAVLCRYAPADKVGMYYCLLDNYTGLRIDCRSKLGEIRDRLK